ncbi:MAG: hypothetical protein ACXABY_31010 [Candidatus Thorarchaeota archaeon]|jgi:hypothetical protein
MELETTKISAQTLESTYHDLTMSIEAECEFLTSVVGGQPADDKGLEAFCKHHLGLTDEEIPAAIARIKDEEIGERDLEAAGELKERESYAVNIIRRDKSGPWLGSWQIKACIKCACTRLGIFMGKKGSKGDLSHLGRVVPIGDSIKSDFLDRVHVYLPDGTPVETSFQTFMGCVNSPQGRNSIVHDSEVIQPGARFAFSLQVPPRYYSNKDIQLIFSVIGQIGIGSVKALERGKFRVHGIEIYRPVSEKKGKK